MNNYNPTIHHRRSIRLKGYDYSQAGLYFITICCQDRVCRLGRIENGVMICNELGEIAYREWMKTAELRPQIELDAFMVMPNHIHGILKINEMDMDTLHSPNNMGDNMGDNTGDNTGECNSPNNTGECNSPNNTGECNSPLRSPSNTIGAIIRGYKSSVTKQFGLMGFDEKLWQRNYYEHIIRDEQSYQIISEYIINNPKKWADDKFYKP